MLTQKQVEEVKEHLNKAQNPLFFFDNDPDGLCSFLLLQRYIGRGKGVPVKTFPGLTVDYFRKVSELSADYIFILDKPVVDREFWEKVEQVNLPVVWIDHHEIDRRDIPPFVNYYNPLYNQHSSNEPVTYLCHQINNKKEDYWFGVIGCISDKYLPDFYWDFKKDFPELCIESKEPFDIFYNSEIGKIARIFSFALKDRVTNVINMLRFLIKAKSPYDVLNESGKNRTMHERYKQVNNKYMKFLEKAREAEKEYKNLLYFQYGGDMSISADLANHLIHDFPNRIVVVIYVSGIKVNVSARGRNVRSAIMHVIEGIEGATGGGHEEAVGARFKIEDIEKFKERLVNFVE